MQEIADEEVKEREKLNANYHVESTNQKDFQKQIKEHEKKQGELKKEKDDIMEDNVKIQKEKIYYQKNFSQQKRIERYKLI